MPDVVIVPVVADRFIRMAVSAVVLGLVFYGFR